MLDKILAMFQKPFEVIDSGFVAVNENYNIFKELVPINYKPPIHHHVLDEKIIDMIDFVEFVNEYATEATKLFVSDNSITAVFNYSTPGKADYGDSIAVMPLIHTIEYCAFKSSLGGNLSQRSFIRTLKRLEPYITALDGKEADDMDVVEMAEELQAIKKVESIQRNASNKFTIDAEVRTGKKDMTIPRTITFKLTPFKNAPGVEMSYTVELFFAACDDGAFSIEMLCYGLDDITEAALMKIKSTVAERISAKSYRV